MPKTKPNKPQVSRPQLSKRQKYDDREAQFKNPLLRVAIAPVAELQRSDPGWAEIDRLGELRKYEGYVEVVER